ncbi:MAG: acyltransferase, partial [Dokdonella sp.]|uniref:acyltransferase family protein n=1 Tax=Dokdonella sp. TaxID=2291710 RepID=UPI003262F2E3
LWRHVGDAYVHVAAPARTSGAWLRDVAATFDAGNVGVVVFFLVSGYVIPFSFKSGRDGAVGSFLIKRFWRIFPAYWLSVPLGALTGFWIWGLPFTLADVAINFTLLETVFRTRSAEGLYWTLLAEWTFYALCVVLFLTHSLANTRRLLGLAVLLLCAYLATVGTWNLGLHALDPVFGVACFYLSIMLSGTLYRTCIAEPGADRRLKAGVIALLAVYTFALPIVGLVRVGLGTSPWVPCAIGFWLFVIGTRWVRVSTRLTDWLGRISYSIYLLHPIVFMALLWWLSRPSTNAWWRQQHLAVYLLVNACITIALAALAFRFVEKPGIRLGHRWARRWEEREAQSVSGTSGDVAERRLREPDHRNHREE